MNTKILPKRAHPVLSFVLLVAAAFAGARALSASQDPLSADASVARVLDAEGVVARRAVLAPRWSGIPARIPLEAGDWLKTGARGANALRLRMAGGAELTLGPNGLLEVVSPTRVVLTRGELGLVVPEGAALEVVGPRGASVAARGRSVLRARDGQLATLEEKPRWLAGYEDNASTEALGSLLCEVDGRNVPLTMGYHQVSVDVRDQLARTVIEESFENHTDGVLEGVFYFPLPADASISGFGMWIGNELVEGEIVEKERAREIYETILREKRDPGLLEWAGGNVFKARVYPIGREKRIKISYTQVLPKQDGAYTYGYALESDLLRQNPLRRLRLSVNVHSSEALVGVTSATHDGRLRAQEHSASFEFEAEQYAPERDFELRIETAPSAGGITLVPHRRGDDGYFMALVDAPPAPAADPGAASPALDVLVVADTSGSMHGRPRENQLAFVEALFGGLGDGDTLQLVTSDVETRWAFAGPQENSAESRAAALEFLEARDALGWSDLEGTLAEVCRRVREDTHVVYVGDGAQTAGDPDPDACARRIEALYRGAGKFHAVASGSSSETSVLRALAGLGEGSVRSVGSDPVGRAFELLEELAAPTLEGLELDFEGLEVFAVHPARLPNLPAGRQHVVLGRFDPTLGELAGRVRLRGSFQGAPFELVTEASLEPGEEGNSFVPRLWARRQLDHLLEQGASAEVQERVIALSEDFQIITPYTSILVLESEADRERFAVKRSQRMRDGEEFFAEGRDASRNELLRAQMLAAKGWRTRLRARLLKALADLERGRTEALREGGQRYDLQRAGQLGALGYAGGGSDEFFLGRAARSAPSGAPFDSKEGEDYASPGDSFEPALEEAELADLPFEADADSSQFGRRMRKSARPTAGPASPGPLAFADSRAGLSSYAGTELRGDWYGPPRDPFSGLFPSVPRPGAARTPPEWPADVLQLVRGLDRRPLLRRGEGGFQLGLEWTSTDARGRVTSSSARQWIARDAWVELGGHAPGRSHPIGWARGGVRGVLLEGWRLGRTRPSEEGDADSWSGLIAWQLGEEPSGYRDYTPVLEELEDGRVRLSLTRPEQPDRTHVLVIDRARALVVESYWTFEGEQQGRRTVREALELAGAWWPRVVDSFDKDGKLVSTSTLTLEELAPGELARRMDAALAPLEDAILLGPEEGSLQAAKQAVRAGSETLEQRWRVLVHFASTQRWERADPHLAAFAERFAGRPGLVAIRATYATAARRGVEVGELLLEAARRLAASGGSAEIDRADWLADLSSGSQTGEERLAILEALAPVYARHPADLASLQRWRTNLALALESTGLVERSFEAWRELAREFPFSSDVQVQFAWRLARRGETDAAVRWLADAEHEHGPWGDREVTALRAGRLEALWNGYQLERLVETFEGWEAAGDHRVDANAPNRHLSALVMLDREPAADARIDLWLAALEGDELEPHQQHRVQAAVQHLLGQGYGLYHQVAFEPERAARLGAAVRGLWRRDVLSWLAGQAIQNHSFRRTAAGRALLAELFAELEANLETLPANQVQNLVVWLRGAEHLTRDTVEDRARWRALVERTYTRWLEAPAQDRPQLRNVVVSHGERDQRLRLLRRELADAEAGEVRENAARTLLAALMEGDWSEEVEAELLGLLAAMRLPPDDDAPEVSERNLDRRIVALYDLCGWLPAARAEATVAALPEVNSMPRRILRSERARALKESRAALAERLRSLEPALAPARLAEFAALERIYLAVKSRSAGEAERERAFELLEGLAAQQGGEGEADAELPERDRVAASRAAATSIWFVTQLPEDERGAALAALRALLERELAAGSELLDWRDVTRVLWVVLDRAEELQAALTRWYGAGEDLADVRWGRDLAHVLAERGQLEQAVLTLRQVERLDEIGHEDGRALADWLTVLDRPEEARAARLASWEALGEYVLSQGLQNELGRYQRRGDEPPDELDPEIPLRFAALLRKSSNPANGLRTLQRYYEVTKDFRLLEGLADGVIGHSAQSVYTFLERSSSLFALIHEEATVDRLVERIARRGEEDLGEVDRRALDLLSFSVLRRAADQAHGTERHVEGALASLRRSERGTWAKGEPGMMASFLASQGALAHAALASEQLRQLRALRGATDESEERFAIGGHLANTLWAYGRREDAVRTLDAALDGLREEFGVLPDLANGQLSTLSSWREALGEWRAAERTWRAELEDEHGAAQERWLTLQLLGFYRNAVGADGETSLGRGERQYVAALELFERELARRSDENTAAQMVATLCDMFQRAFEGRSIARAATDAGAYAFGELPAVLDLYQHRRGQQMVQSFANCLRDLQDPTAALEFYVTRAENEPRWLRLARQDFWSRHGYGLADRRAEARTLAPTLEQRVLAIMLRAQRADLASGTRQGRAGFDQRQTDYWSEKRADFLRVALEVLEARRESGEIAAHVAEYLFEGLAAHDQAIDALRSANDRDLLDLDGRRLLAEYLQRQERWLESLVPLAGLVLDQPQDAHLRVMQMRAHFHLGDANSLLGAYLAAETWLREHGLWEEGAIATLARGCLDTELFERAVVLYDEAIALHVKSAPGRGIGDGVLSVHYREQSRAYAALGRLDEAVDAAAGAVVSWGSNIHQRGEDLRALEEVLRDAEDLDGYVERLEVEVRASGLENPILRKAIGKAYLARERHAAAAAQLRLALEAQPNDDETHTLLVEAYDALGRGDLAAEALLARARFLARDVDAFTELGARLAKLGDVPASERAYTSLVEALPNESEGHQRLAEIRQQQRRWDEALASWRQVARVRSIEPTGHLGVARSLIHLERFEEAREVLRDVIGGDWPERFKGARSEAERLLRDLPRRG